MAMVACGGTTTKNMYAESPPQPRKVLGMPLVEALKGLVRAERLPAREQFALEGGAGATIGANVVGLTVGRLVRLAPPIQEPGLGAKVAFGDAAPWNE